MGIHQLLGSTPLTSNFGLCFYVCKWFSHTDTRISLWKKQWSLYYYMDSNMQSCYYRTQGNPCFLGSNIEVRTFESMWEQGVKGSKYTKVKLFN